MFTFPAGREAVVTFSAGGETIIESGAVADTDALSVTRTVKPLVPAAEGVPEMAPLAARLSPEGSEPLPTDQV